MFTLTPPTHTPPPEDSDEDCTSTRTDRAWLAARREQPQSVRDLANARVKSRMKATKVRNEVMDL